MGTERDPGGGPKGLQPLFLVHVKHNVLYFGSLLGGVFGGSVQTLETARVSLERDIVPEHAALIGRCCDREQGRSKCARRAASWAFSEDTPSLPNKGRSRKFAQRSERGACLKLSKIDRLKRQLRIRGEVSRARQRGIDILGL
jgi:hypothetical protein